MSDSDPSPSLTEERERAEIAKLHAEAKVLARTPAYELIKVVGAGLLGVGGVIAAINQYQIAEARAANAELAIKLSEQRLAEVNREIQRKNSKSEIDLLFAKQRNDLLSLQLNLENSKTNMLDQRKHLDAIQKLNAQIVSQANELLKGGSEAPASTTAPATNAP